MTTHFNDDSTGKMIKSLCENKTATRASTEYPDVTCKKCLKVYATLDAQAKRDAYERAMRNWESWND